MKQYFFLALLSVVFLVPSVSLAQSAGGGGGGGVVCDSTCQTITLSSGWNIVSTPKVLESHSFSVSETSSNFDIYVLDPSEASGWATLADLGQTEFTPLYGYFINNKTGIDQTLTFTYKADVAPNDRLFSRSFSTSGWYSIGVANATYARPVGSSALIDTNNPGNILSGLSAFFTTVIDLTHGWFSSDANKVAVSETWKAAVPADINSLHDFRETKGYAMYINANGGSYIGFQSETESSSAIFSIENASSVASQNIVVNTSNQRLGGFTISLSEEMISVPSMVFYIATSSTGTGLLTAITLVDQNGAVVAGPVDATYDAVSGKQRILFNDIVTFQIGNSTYTLKGKLPATFVNNGTLVASTNPQDDWGTAMGETSNSEVNLPDTTVVMNAMTVRTGSLSVTAGSQPASQNIVGGEQAYTFSTILLDATTSGEDIRLSSLPVYFESPLGTFENYLSGCQVYDGSTTLNTGSRVVNTILSSAQNVFTLDNSLTVTKGTVKTITLKCNVGASASGSGKFGVNGGNWVATGITSGTTITVAAATGSYSGTITVATGSFTVSIDPSSPSYALAAAGSSGVTMGVLKLRATNEAVQLTRLGLVLTSGSPSDITQAYIYDGATLIGGAVFTGINTTATSTLSTPLTLPKDTDKLLIVKANLAQIGPGQDGTPGALIQMNPLNAEGSGMASGLTIKTGATSGVAGVRLQNSYPTFALDSLTSVGMADGRLMRFKITANSSDAVGVYRLTFRGDVTTGVVVDDMKLYAYTDSSYTNAVASFPAGLVSSNGLVMVDDGEGSDGDFKFVITPNGIQVPAGSTYYFELRGTVTGVSAGSAVSINLMGDSNAVPLLSAEDTANLSGTNVIWTPNSMGMSTAATSDWTNGYGIPGLPANGLTQTRSN